MRPALVRLFTAAGLATVAGRPAESQGLASVSGAALSVSTLAEADYDAGYSGATQNFIVVTTCTGTGPPGCRLFLQYGANGQGQQVDMEYAIVSLNNACDNAVANANAWFAVQPTTVVLSTKKNQQCSATFRFRVSPLTWTAYQSPGPPGSTYRQQIVFVFTKP